MLEDLGNLGDFLGGIGVVVTLVYLAIQIRRNTAQVQQNTKAVSAAAHNSLTENLHLYNSQMISSDSVAALIIKADHGFTNLSDTEGMRFLAMSSSMFRIFENIFHHHQAGLLTDEQWRGWRQLLIHNLRRSQGHRDFWRDGKAVFTGDYQLVIDSILAESEDTDDSPAV